MNENDEEKEDNRPDCPGCEGNGWIYDPKDGGTMTCPNCDGEGKIEADE